MSADSYADLLERLFGDYEGRHSIPVIEKVVSESRAQLAGQSPPGAQLELLDRLATATPGPTADSTDPLTDPAAGTPSRAPTAFGQLVDGHPQQRRKRILHRVRCADSCWRCLSQKGERTVR